jgi:hypothetical protein
MVISVEGLRRCPDMVRQIRCAVGEIIRIEEGERIDQKYGGGD